jgi:hypothetical protein
LLTYSCSLPTFLTSSLSSISSDMQYTVNHLTITSGEICCHGLTTLAQQFHSGLLYYLPWWCQNMVPCQDPFGIQLFQIIFNQLSVYIPCFYLSCSGTLKSPGHLICYCGI